MCTTTPSDINCTNSGTAPAFFLNTAVGANQNATTTNSGTANAFESQTTGGGNAAVSNSGINIGGALAVTMAGGNATATNTSTIAGGRIFAQTIGSGDATATNSGSVATGVGALTNVGNATAINSGTIATGFATLAFALVSGDATAINSGTSTGVGAAANIGNATATNSGTSIGGVSASTVVSGNATVTNSGTTSSQLVATTGGVGNATVTNSGTNFGAIIATTGGMGGGSGDALVNNSGRNIGGTIAVFTTGLVGNATVINSGLAQADINPKTMLPFDAIEVVSFFNNATLTNIVGGRVFGGIVVDGATQNINYVGGNWLQSISLGSGSTAINSGGAPFVAVPTATGIQIAVLDPTAFALADRSLVSFTGQIGEMLQGRFDGMSTGAGGSALGFAGAPSSPVADQAQAAFGSIPSVAMSYASDARSVIGKVPKAAAPYYDTTIWASGFGGERKQHADGSILPTTDIAYGGAMGVDRILGGNLRLGAFVGAGASSEKVELDVQKLDATYVFGGVYGRFDWISQYFDFSLYGGGIDNKSTRGIANNTVPGGFENASASYGGWFISPEVIYGYRIPFKAITATPRLRLRYVGGWLDGFSETGSMQNLSVGRRAINDLEERAEVELSTVTGAFKATVTAGVIGLERLGNPTINTVLLAQNLSFTTPGQKATVGGVLGMGLQYRPMPNVKLFVAGEGTAMSDRSDSWAATGGAQVSF
jgi:uncharacterized protein with beta-barrel porin domain